MARRLLDRVHSLAALAELEADPGAYAAALADELPPVTVAADVPARDAAIAAALADIDTATARVMGLRLEYALSAEPSIPATTRKVFATTITAYANDLPLLASRARDVAVRGGSRDPDAVATLVTDAARATFALRDALRAGVIALHLEPPPAPEPEPEPTRADLIELD